MTMALLVSGFFWIRMRADQLHHSKHLDASTRGTWRHKVIWQSKFAEIKSRWRRGMPKRISCDPQRLASLRRVNP